MELDSFWILYFYSEGNTRKAFNVLGDAMQDVEEYAYKIIKQINIVNVLEENNNSINHRLIKITNYLYVNGPTHASDKSFQQFVDITDKPLRNELEELCEKKQVDKFEETIGKSSTTFF